METIYITGHKNPDLDSVCSAYAYAKLMNLQDPDNEYIPVRCGHLSDSTRSILDQLDTDIPQYMRDVYPKVRDVMLQSDHKINAADPLTSVAAVYGADTPSAIPVYENDGFYCKINYMETKRKPLFFSSFELCIRRSWYICHFMDVSDQGHVLG
jgi:manganese-dependent inorganic pyrophosphatase